MLVCPVFPDTYPVPTIHPQGQSRWDEERSVSTDYRMVTSVLGKVVGGMGLLHIIPWTHLLIPDTIPL